MAAHMLYMEFDEKCVQGLNNYRNSFMAKFFLVVEPSCLKKQVLKPKCAVTNVG